jgi:hypothetical protein
MPKQFKYQREVLEADSTSGSYDRQLHGVAMDNHEPLLVCMDALIRYAKAFKFWIGDPLSHGDYVLGAYWLDALKSVHALLNGLGAVAMESGAMMVDSKSNAAMENLFWEALEIAGYEEEDL